MAPVRIGIVGLGKIALDQHVPSIRGNPAFDLVAVSSQRGHGLEGVAHAFTGHRDMLEGVPGLDAIAICTPPQVRHVIARDCLRAGKHVLLEKPPSATLSELADLEALAAEAGRVLFATWHSRFNAGVDAAKAALRGRRVRSMEVTWRESVRRWHPGQTWIWEAGGFGVFDPGINALSIVTEILPDPIFVARADLETPENAEAPIAATLHFSTGGAEEALRAVFDWRETGDQTWEVAIVTDEGRRLTLSAGGARLAIDGRIVADEPPAEYEGIYARFADLIGEGRSDVDARPFRLVADAFMIGRRIPVEPFHE